MKKIFVLIFCALLVITGNISASIDEDSQEKIIEMTPQSAPALAIGIMKNPNIIKILTKNSELQSVSVAWLLLQTILRSFIIHTIIVFITKKLITVIFFGLVLDLHNFTFLS